jgi:predicted RNA binding protein YcfA (HicA-like mRNA interferase family)
MKRNDLTRHLEKLGCIFIREGGNHTIYKNPANGRMTSIPRHREVKENLVKKICDDLGVERP